ncbi:hypothetical protein M2368_001582 [Arthrobacter sp. JUb119]|uniref:DUF5671 domain-containing protein n=1 Tax=Arthrobacter sp. MYb214 TaxID=1848596 RepID=UPI000CFD98F3|nr:DUF5671 domain-containing protein [Arthrobacter sp. MYb214]MCS3492579.1 hypothetical protein [Arthrobacter sp. JUb119]PRB76858.1 hypothetical protein CQ012_07585 [Arthrobacter sp. MYb214]
MAATAPAFHVQSSSVLRPVILHGLLFVLLMVSATGLSTLFTALFHGFDSLLVSTEQLAMAFTFTLVGIPLAWLLWRSIRKRLARPSAFDSAIWSLQASAAYLATLAASSCAALAFLAGLVSAARDGAWQSTLAVALGWGTVCAWQHRQITSPRTAPRQFAQLAATAGNYFSMVLFALSLIATLTVALEILVVPENTLVGPTGMPNLLMALVWLAGSSALWFWHWKLRRVQKMSNLLNSVLLVVLGLAAPALAFLLAIAELVSWVWPQAWTAQERTELFLDGGPSLLAIIVAAAVLWIYHQSQLRSGLHPASVVGAAHLALSGVSLAVLATGLGMVVNALFAALGSSVSVGYSAGLLGHGLGLLAFGAAAWLWYFKPWKPFPADSRSAYLVLFFGASSVVALVSLLVFGYRIFEFYLEPDSRLDSLLDTVRGPLGWLVATAAVAGYHFALWRSDKDSRAGSSGESIASQGAITRRAVVIVGPAASEPMAAQLKARPELAVTWMASSGPALDDRAEVSVLARIEEYLATHHDSFMVLAEADGSVRFINLA